jgi:hypothetical protein
LLVELAGIEWIQLPLEIDENGWDVSGEGGSTDQEKQETEYLERRCTSRLWCNRISSQASCGWIICDSATAPK